MADLDLPDNEFYEDYPQLENGVGMMRLFITEFENAKTIEPARGSTVYSIVTGTLAHKYLVKLSKIFNARYDTITFNVYAVRNDFFGEKITVSGLITGGDIIAQLKGKVTGSKLLIPQNMLRSGEETFLDDITVPELSEALGVPVRIVKQDGADFVHALLGQ